MREFARQYADLYTPDMGFIVKRVHRAGSIGEDLRDLRVHAGWSVSQAAHALKFTESFLRALEEERWEATPDPISTERMLKSYVIFFDGNVSYFLNKYRECLNDCKVERLTEDHLPRPSRVRFLELTVGPRWIAAGVFIIFSCALGAYVFWQARAISSKPFLSIEQPVEGQRLEAPRVLVRGRTTSESSVTVNEKKAVVQSDGTFSMELDVARGVTSISIAAHRRYGAETVEIRHVVYERATPFFIENTTNTERDETFSF